MQLIDSLLRSKLSARANDTPIYDSFRTRKVWISYCVDLPKISDTNDVTSKSITNDDYFHDYWSRMKLRIRLISNDAEWRIAKRKS